MRRFLIMQLACIQSAHSPSGPNEECTCTEFYIYTAYINNNIWLCVCSCVYVWTHSDSAAGRRPCFPPVQSGSRRTECWWDCGSPDPRPAACGWRGPAGRRVRPRPWWTAARPPRGSHSSPEHTGGLQLERKTRETHPRSCYSLRCFQVIRPSVVFSVFSSDIAVVNKTKWFSGGS